MTHLPSDPSIPENWLLFLVFIVIPIAFVVFLVQKIIKKQTHILFFAGCIFLFASPAVYSIISRNFGEWAELKSLILDYEVSVEKFVIENGLVTTYEEKLKLYEQYPPPIFKFKGENEVIFVSYLEWVSSENKMGVSWGNGANAAFNLETMWCVYSD